MSRPRYYWYPTVRRMTMRYYELEGAENEQEQRLYKAITAAFTSLDRETYPEERKQAVTAVLLRHRMTVTGAAYQLHFSERTVQRWINAFILDVGRRAGF